MWRFLTALGVTTPDLVKSKHQHPSVSDRHLGVTSQCPAWSSPEADTCAMLASGVASMDNVACHAWSNPVRSPSQSGGSSLGSKSLSHSNLQKVMKPWLCVRLVLTWEKVLQKGRLHWKTLLAYASRSIATRARISPVPAATKTCRLERCSPGSRLSSACPGRQRAGAASIEAKVFPKHQARRKVRSQSKNGRAVVSRNVSSSWCKQLRDSIGGMLP